MTRSRIRRLALSTITLGIFILVAAAFFMKDPVLEWWHIRQLEQGDEETQKQAIQALGHVGRETAFVKLTEFDMKIHPESLSWGQNRHANALAAPRSRRASPLIYETPDARGRIAGRIGWDRARIAQVRYMKDPTADARTRTYIAQLLILSVTSEDVLPNRGFRMERQAPGTALYQQYLEGKPAAIAACIEALSSDDPYSRGGAAFALSLCGPEALRAVPALERALGDADPFVKEAAEVALERIREE